MTTSRFDQAMGRTRERNERYSHRLDAIRYMLPQEVSVRFHQVTLQILDNGAVLMQVGCKSLGFASYEIALTELTRYYQNPKGVEREYAERYGWPTAAPGEQIAQGSPIRTMGGLGQYVESELPR